jgi:hypothetical protein
MTRRLSILVAAALLIYTSASLLAHEHIRVIGDVTSIQETMISVKKKDATIKSIRIDKQTVVVRNAKKVPLSDVKIGQSVVVDGYGDSEDDLLAIEILIVPALATAK